MDRLVHYHLLKTVQNRRRYLVVGITSTAVIIILIILWLVSLGTQPRLDLLAQKANFNVFYPRSSIKSKVSVQQRSLAYNSSNNGLSYVALIDGKRVTVSEQATPDIFSENGVYEYKLSQANEYDSFETSSGEVALTRPGGLQGQTVAWVNSKGTLILVRDFQSLSNNEWKLLFNNMQVVNIN